MTFLAMGFGPNLQFQIGIPSCGAGLKSNPKAYSCCHNICANVEQVGTYCLKGYYSMQDLLLGNSTDSLSPPDKP